METTAEPLIIRIDLVAIRAQCDDQRLWQDDLAEGDEFRDAERGRALVLAARHTLDRSAQDLGLIGGGIERQRQEPTIPGFAEKPPEIDGFQPGRKLPRP